MRKLRNILVAVAAILALASCEKAVIDEETPTEERGRLTLRVAGFEQIPFDTRSQTDVAQLCTHISFVLFNGDEKVKELKQKEGDSDFGTVSMNVAAGTYKLVVIAHSCEGNATVSKTTEIKFPNNVVSDTFYYFGEITVSGQQESHDLTLRRCASMFRFDITDDMPSEVRKMKFYYTGGSSTFSAETGYGSVNSRQTVNIDVTSAMWGKPNVFEVYTLLHDEEGKLKMTVTALDGSDNALYEQVFEGVPMRRNTITRYSGAFFTGGGSGSADQAFTLTADGEWSGENPYTF